LEEEGEVEGGEYDAKRLLLLGWGEVMKRGRSGRLTGWTEVREWQWM
jgi:hypothetical protein